LSLAFMMSDHQVSILDKFAAIVLRATPLWFCLAVNTSNN
jgi:hypothetical protein